MGRINIRGGSPLRMDFELANGEKSPGNFEVKLVLHSSGNWYEVERTDGVPFGTAVGRAAKMRVTGVVRQEVVVDYNE
ncbi:MAG: hypothetical protein IH877_03800 [Gemmatimonadetes bacterium]|nr:hypothetical protein [Gemmatimonadota bacterium]